MRSQHNCIPRVKAMPSSTQYKKESPNTKLQQIFNRSICGLMLGLCSSVSVYAADTETVAPAPPTWGLDPALGTLLKPGIAVMTMGATEDTYTEAQLADIILNNPNYADRARARQHDPLDGDHTLKLHDVNGVTYTPSSSTTAPVDHAVHTHHHWDIGSIGNVYGLAIDKSRNIYATASTAYSNGYHNVAGTIGYGAIGNGTSTESDGSDGDTTVLNSTAAAGTIYKLDAVTGDATVFAQLPQQAYAFEQTGCQGGSIAGGGVDRNTGPALGNIAYDSTHNQFFVSNFEDGKIYRLGSGGAILDSFDPFVADDGSAGLAPDARPYGLTLNPDGTKLYFGTHELNFQPRLFAVNLDGSGGFSGSEVDQHAQMEVDLEYSLEFGGGGLLTDPWLSYSDLAFTPAGELMVGVKSGCNNSPANANNHGTPHVLLVADENGLYSKPSPRFPKKSGISGGDAGLFRFNEWYSAGYSDNGYGGVAAYDKGNGEFDYLLTGSDLITSNGPTGFYMTPGNFTLEGSYSIDFVNSVAAFASLPSSRRDGRDIKDNGGDIEVLSVPKAAAPPPNTQPVPTLSEWALMLLMMLLGFIGYQKGLPKKD